jgi:hypothetical protein
MDKGSLKSLLHTRFIDDIFGLWTSYLKRLQTFPKYANDIHLSILIAIRWSKDEIEFLRHVCPNRKRQYFHGLEHQANRQANLRNEQFKSPYTHK